MGDQTIARSLLSQDNTEECWQNSWSDPGSNPRFQCLSGHRHHSCRVWHGSNCIFTNYIRHITIRWPSWDRLLRYIEPWQPWFESRIMTLCLNSELTVDLHQRCVISPRVLISHRHGSLVKVPLWKESDAMRRSEVFRVWKLRKFQHSVSMSTLKFLREFKCHYMLTHWAVGQLINWAIRPLYQ
jgi:hypothetical protein